MGQRLVITLKDGKRDLAAIYYHWSAYTYDALSETKKVINCIYNHQEETAEEMLLKLIKFIEKNGGGIVGREEEFEYIQKLYPREKFKRDNYSRNYGLVALSPDGIEVVKGWSEGDVDIQLDSDMVDFGVYSGYSSLEAYLDEREEWDEDFDRAEFEQNIPKLNCNLGYFNIYEIDEVIAAIESVDGEYVVQCEDEICELTC